MFLNIPRLKTELFIKEDIVVPIHCENRNMAFLFKRGLVPDKNAYHVKMCDSCNIESIVFRCPKCNQYALGGLAIRQVLLPKGAKLIVDRYYIRNGNEDFDSVTFRYHEGKEKSRFWLKLGDASKIDFA